MENQFVTILGFYQNGNITPQSQFLPKGSFKVLITFLEPILDNMILDTINTESPELIRKKIQESRMAQYGLTAREYEILQLVQKGFTNREISEKMELGDGTVRNYVSSILSKLKVNNRTQMVNEAIRSGLIEPE